MRKKYLPWFVYLIITNASADENSIRLYEAEGKDQVTANCSLCHSLDYIPMHSGVLDKSGWEKTVNKMIDMMGAPVSADDAAVITAYLAKYYGKK